jgi:ribosomal protein S1
MTNNNTPDRLNERSEFERLLEEEFSPSQKNCSANEVITGIPVKITREGAFIAITGKKTESFIPANELPSLVPLVENQATEFQVVSEEGEDGQFRLSYAWTAAAKLSQEGTLVEVVAKHRNDPGLDVEIPGLGKLQAFAPKSLLGNAGSDAIKGKKLLAKIIEVTVVPAEGRRPARRRLIVSPLAAQLSFIKSLKKGQAVSAKVRRIEPTFAVVEFAGGATALVFRSEMSIYGQAEDLTAAKAEDRELEFEVTDINLADANKPSVKVSRRSILVRSRREELERSLRVGDAVSARVTHFTKDGRRAFLLVEDCLPASIDVYKLPVFAENVSDVFERNQVIRAKFIGVHEKSGNLKLSMKGIEQ